MKIQFKEIVPHLVAILVFVVAGLIHFYPQLEGKVLRQSDTMIFTGAAQETESYKEKTGETSLWTNSMFGGMPTYQINAPGNGMYIKQLMIVVQMFTPRPMGYFLGGCLLFYVLMIALGASPWLSIMAALSFVFGVNHLVLLEAGHNTKIRSLFSFAPILAGLILTYNSRLIWGGVLFLVGLSINLWTNHIQMTYLFFLVMFFYFLVSLIQTARNSDWISFLKKNGILLAGLIIALCSVSSRYITTYEYSKDTMRGAPILDPPQDGQVRSSSETDGLEWNYATNWSNSTLDLFAGFIPGIVGGSSAELVSDDGPLVKELRRRGVRQKDLRVPTYWGGAPSTSGPIYFGALVMFLFVLALWTMPKKHSIWVGVGTLLLLLLSMGSNAEWLTRFFFEYVPLYNKFRTPNSIMGVAGFFVVFYAFWGLANILRDSDRQKYWKPAMYSAGVLGVLALFFAFVGPGMFDFVGSSDPRLEQAGFPMDAVLAERESMMRGDALRSFFFVALGLGIFYWFWIRKHQALAVIIGLGVLSFLDIRMVSARYLTPDEFVSKRNFNQAFVPRPVDQSILKDPDIHYRVHDESINSFNESSSSYFHKTIGGNHPAKLQRYQDLIDRHIGRGNMRVYNMLNTKYFIRKNEGGQLVHLQNPQALGNAWLVSEIKTVNTANEEIDQLNVIDPATTAVVHQEFSDYIQGLQPSVQGSIQLTEYAPNRLKYNYNGSAESFAVFSEIWYGPDKGWQAYIDGQPVDHIRVNFALRGMKLPAGKHEIVFEFDPKSWKTGTALATIASIIIYLSLFGAIYLEWKRKAG